MFPELGSQDDRKVRLYRNTIQALFPADTPLILFAGRTRTYLLISGTENPRRKKRQLRFGWVSPLLQNAGGRSFLPSPRSRFGEFTGSGWPQGFKRQRPLWTDGFCEIIQSERGRKEGSPFTSRAERAPSRRGDLIQNLCQLYKLVSDFFPRLNRQA